MIIDIKCQLSGKHDIPAFTTQGISKGYGHSQQASNEDTTITL